MKYITLTRILVVTTISLISLGLHAGNQPTSLDDLRPMTIYKSSTCGCCNAWVEHIESADIPVRVKDLNSLDELKQQLGVEPRYQACHTGVKSGYFFEGHIPAEVIKQFLKEKPEDVAGLSVPGMPMGSPGMDVEGRFRTYEVLTIFKDGSNKVYAKVAYDTGVTFIREAD